MTDLDKWEALARERYVLRMKIIRGDITPADRERIAEINKLLAEYDAKRTQPKK